MDAQLHGGVLVNYAVLELVKQQKGGALLPASLVFSALVEQRGYL